MKNKEIIMILNLISVILLVSCSQRGYADKFTYFVRKCAEKIIIDGVLDDDAWTISEQIILKNNRTGESIRNETILTRTKACYDDENFYVAFECYDPDILSEYTERDEPLWNQDVVEIFIDTDDEMDTYYEIEISPQNVIFDTHIIIPTQIDVADIAQFNLTGIRTAVFVEGTLNNRADTDHKWTIELAIPFEDFIASSDKRP
ncbi:MAG: hypothetical protein GWN01_11355, partial [Nitrosopumilaceae archaeon]|nr:hypothetical protein [Nitrosopumilaceae archaeon]NIU87902.1 hypothetical protein [Nitrosopumilaceae archaeon]NIV66193.1 hypothetical protein [Nitrosopumilaceae archaeon]NIX62082.1 hypothetical protein [Nitrosopumilaceae archaeon]